jgi:F-type H+-transporting ATPase subunit epsilon
MAVNFKFELVSPERVLMSEDVEHVVLPGIEGDMGVLAGHAPFVVTLRPGVITVLGGDSPRKVYVKDGFAEFTPDTLNVLAEQAVNLSGAGAGVVDGLIKDAEKSLEEAKDDAERFLASSAIEALKTA